MSRDRQWDSIGKRHVRVGARRWEVEWEVFVSQDAADEAAECLEDWHYETNCRSFPTFPLALAFARRIDEPLAVWSPRIQEQRFDGDENGAGCGWWNGCGEWLDVEAVSR